MEQDNGWYERGELPPVGVECEFNVCDSWEKCEIKGDGYDCGHRVVLVQVGDRCVLAQRPNPFRPLKTEREKLVERFEREWRLSKHSLVEFLAEQYDKGLRYTE